MPSLRYIRIRMNKIIIYYKKGCSKCKAAMDILEGESCEIEVREYLKKKPSKKELKVLLAKLGISAFELVRKKEPLFIKKFLNKKFSEAEWLQIVFEHPELMERPIIIDGYKAIIGRPPELIIDLLNRKKK